MIIVSACLLGENCKYNGKNNKNQKIIDYLKDKEYVTVCPEQLGGLSTPRDPSEIITDNKNDGKAVLSRNTKILSNKGIDVSENFIMGAIKTLQIAKENNATSAILKESSPSCGYTYIYDGTFSGKKINGMGVTASLLYKNNIEIIDVDKI